jgi:hypothetical protein
VAKGSLDAVERIVQAAGGRLLRRQPTRLLPGKHVVVSAADDAEIAARIRRDGHRVYTFDLISYSILRQKLARSRRGFDDAHLLKV